MNECRHMVSDFRSSEDAFKNVILEIPQWEVLPKFDLFVAKSDRGENHF